MNSLLNPDVDRTLQLAFQVVVPEAVLVATACALLLLGAFGASRLASLAAALAGVVLALVAAWAVPAPEGLVPTVTPFLPDALAIFVRVVALLSAFVFIAMGWSESRERHVSEYLACVLVAAAGVSLVGAANDLLALFLALEMVSIPTYVLLYIPRQEPANQEAAAKYFLLSVLASALTLFGFSYLYGVTGTLNLSALVTVLPRAEAVSATSGLAVVAAVMVLAGVGFRITAVPFHFYAPDVYQGGPTGVVAFLAFVPKLAGFAVLLRLIAAVGIPSAGGPPFAGQVPMLVWILAAITMTVGNVLALLQDNLKRLLAYSSVAHAGYLLIGLAVAADPAVHASAGATFKGTEAVLFYLVAYGAMTVGAFAVLAYLHTDERPVETVDDLAGLHESRPGMAAAMAVFLFSLIGMPLTAGFAGKLLLFAGALGVPESSPMREYYVWLAVIAAVNAAVAAYYYLRVAGVMYLRSAFRPFAEARSPALTATVLACVGVTLAFGVYPWPLWDAARWAVAAP